MRAVIVTTLGRRVRYGLLAVLLMCFPTFVAAAPFAAYVMDARTGETLYSQNANTPLHPASLTKMMTLYLAFEAIERGRVSLDSMVTVTANAANQPPSRLGLRAGQKIQLRYLIRAAAVKSANDAASAIGDFLGGNEDRFAAQMTSTARRLGMRNTTFKNANGLTRSGHLSTAQDMGVLGRHLLYDFPQYYNLFSRRTADAGIAKVASTNRKFLSAYDGADGIKTGYTVAAGFNLVGSAQRGNKRIIGVVFGGTSTPMRNAKMAELLDMGFARAPNTVKGNTARPQLVARATSDLAGPEVTGNVQADDEEDNDKVIAAPSNSQRPIGRPEAETPSEELIAAVAPTPTGQMTSIRPMPSPRTNTTAVASVADAPARTPAQTGFIQSATPQPETLEMAAEATFPDGTIEEGDANPDTPSLIQNTPQPPVVRKPRNDTVILAALSPPAPVQQQEREVVSRAGGGRNWGISIGSFASKYAAERALLKTALADGDTLTSARREVQTRRSAFEATFLNMTKGEAQLACARLTARTSNCSLISF